MEEAIASRPHALHAGRIGQPRSLYHVLLLLIVFFCLSPVSALLQPAVLDSRSGEITVAPDLLAQFPGADDSDRTNTTDDNASHDLQRRASTSSLAMPRPFDSLATDFASASCVTFFSDFLSNSTVTDCHAVSMLLENSASFFYTLRSAAATSAVLDVSCSVPITNCAAIMTSLANEMLRDNNCGADYQSKNAVVRSAYDDMIAYEPVARATCLTNPHTQDYCFVDAVDNSHAPNDYNVYFLPLGITLGRHTSPTCNICLQATMGVFAHWASVNNQPLDRSYLASARAVNRYCGAQFASTHVHPGTNTVASAAGAILPALRLMWALALVLGLTLATGI